jgi:hypothetical protein
VLFHQIKGTKKKAKLDGTWSNTVDQDAATPSTFESWEFSVVPLQDYGKHF